MAQDSLDLATRDRRRLRLSTLIFPLICTTTTLLTHQLVQQLHGLLVLPSLLFSSVRGCPLGSCT